jgi:hypothetical protein
MVSSGIEYRNILRYRGAIPPDSPTTHQAVSQFNFRVATAPITEIKSLVESPRAGLPQHHLYSDGVCCFSRVIASVQLIDVCIPIAASARVDCVNRRDGHVTVTEAALPGC